MFWMIAPAIAAAEAVARFQAASQTAARHKAAVAAYHAERKCQYCGTDNERDLCPNCGAPQPERRCSWPSYPTAEHYEQPARDLICKPEEAMNSTEADRKKRRNDDDAAQRRRENVSTGYTPSVTDTSYSPPDTSDRSDTSSSSGSFDGGGASGDY